MSAIPFPSALSRHERLWPAVLLSAGAHLALAGWAVVRQQPPMIDLEQKPIVAKLVRLGEKRPEQWLPRKEEAPPAPAPAPAAPAAPVLAPPKPAAPSVRGKAPPRTAAAPSPAPGSSGQSLSSILSKVRREAVAEKQWGDPNGDAAGDSDVAEGDQFLAQVQRALHANYVAPATISERERLYLEAHVTIWVEPDGRIARWRQDRASGNPSFDAAVERALRLTSRVPPPPDAMRDALRRNGISLVFQAR